MITIAEGICQKSAVAKKQLYKEWREKNEHK